MEVGRLGDNKMMHNRPELMVASLILTAAAATGSSADDPISELPRKPAKPLAATDLYGDPLPPGAIARMGTIRFWHGSLLSGVAFSRDGTVLATIGSDVRLWETASGKVLLERQGTEESLRKMGFARSQFQRLRTRSKSTGQRQFGSNKLGMWQRGKSFSSFRT